MSQFLLVFISTAVALTAYVYTNHLLSKKQLGTRAIRLIISLTVLFAVNFLMRFLLVQTI
jgi:hypothetical protein